MLNPDLQKIADEFGLTSEETEAALVEVTTGHPGVAPYELGLLFQAALIIKGCEKDSAGKSV